MIPLNAFINDCNNRHRSGKVLNMPDVYSHNYIVDHVKYNNV